MALMSRNARDDQKWQIWQKSSTIDNVSKISDFGDHFSANFVKLVKSSIGIDSSWVNIGDFGEIDKIGNFGNILPIS